MGHISSGRDQQALASGLRGGTAATPSVRFAVGGAIGGAAVLTAAAGGAVLVVVAASLLRSATGSGAGSLLAEGSDPASQVSAVIGATAAVASAGVIGWLGAAFAVAVLEEAAALRTRARADRAGAEASAARSRGVPRPVRRAASVVVGALLLGAPGPVLAATTGDQTDRTGHRADTAGHHPGLDRPAAPEQRPGRVVVRAGDTLWALAADRLPPGHRSAAEIAGAWPRWYQANRTVVGPDPDLIRPGQVLRAPPGVRDPGDLRRGSPGPSNPPGRDRSPERETR